MSAAQDDVMSWRVSSLGDRRSVIGSIAVVAVVALFVLGVPFVEGRVEQSVGLDAEGRFIVDDYTAIRLADGWSVSDRSEFFTTATDGTYDLVLVVSNLDETPPADALRTIHDAYSGDPANTVGAIEEFSTDAGGEVASYRAVIASDPSGNGSAFYAVAQNGRLLQPAATGPADLDDPFYDAVEEMVRSVVITAEPREGAA